MSAFESAQSVYARNLLSHRGYPLWTPEPDPQLPILHREEGLQIGDVGVVIPSQGSFDVFFNICLPREHELHQESGVPDNFSYVPLKNKDVRFTSNAEQIGCVISSHSAERVADHAVDNSVFLSEYEFKLSSSEGSILILPQGAESRILLNVLPFIEKAKRGALHWYKFAREVLGRNIRDDALYLITGFYKAHSWSVASFRSAGDTTESSARFFRIADQVDDGGIATAYTWFTTRPVDRRVGPDYNATIPTQSVFITGLKIAIRNDIPFRRSVAVQVDLPSVHPGDVDFPQAIGGPSLMESAWTRVSGMFGTGNSDTRMLGAAGTGDSGMISHFPEVLQPFHPSDAINRYMLIKEPSANIAITHDNDWIHILGNQNPEEVLRGDGLGRGLMKKFDIISRDGAVYLQRKQGPAIRGGRRGPPRGGGAARGGHPTRGAAPGPAIRVGPPPAGGAILPGMHVQAVGVRRSGYGNAGKAITVSANFFSITLPEASIHHYDVISPSEETLPARLNLELIDHLQKIDSPDVFTPPAVYDGRKNMFAPRELPLGPTGSREFSVSLPDETTRCSPGENTSGRGPCIYKVRLTKVATINPEALQRFIMGQQSQDNSVSTALTALNVVIRMEPTMKYPFNVRSFFTDRETKDIGSGLVLWRGYFQSVRPAIGRLLVNVDISTGTMYKPGPLLDLCLDFLGRPGQPQLLSPRHGFPNRERIRLQRFLAGIRIMSTYSGDRVRRTPRVVKKLSSVGVSDLSFSMRDGTTMTVAQYFQKLLNRPLRFPDIICIEVGSGALLPLELCTVPPGQIMRKQVPPEKTTDVLEFATKKPHDRLQSINKGLSVLAHGQSEYVRQFGMAVDEASGPIVVPARVLAPPKLRYGQDSPQPVVTPAYGAWNMIDKRFFRPATIECWIVVVYERQQRFNQQAANDMIDGLVRSCSDVGMKVNDQSPIVTWQNSQGRIADQLRSAGNDCFQKTGHRPTLIVVVLPANGNDIYTAVKHFGDVTVGVATQCLKGSKCFRAKPQYYANVCLKMNVKLGGINTIPDPRSVTILTNPWHPTIVMGAHVIHPAPGSEGRPSFTALVGNVDSHNAKYIATSRVQGSHVKIIADLKDMAKHILTMYMRYRQMAEKKSDVAPTRLIFYRAGVSEGQFRDVLEKEVAALKAACEELKIKPKITVIVVAKRHHVRFFPRPSDADRSGNCPAGTVVDQVVTHPIEFDWYLLSHGGLLGTSRPAHYNVLYDENNFNADSLQALSFALCHVYARCTHSVSRPAPLYYADLVCSRAKNHYDPEGTVDFSHSATEADKTQAEGTLEAFHRGYKPLHLNMATVMYFS